MDSKYQIELNFLPVTGTLPPFLVYRSIRRDSDPKPNDGVFGFSLPVNRVDEGREQYWVQFSAQEGFEEFQVQAAVNIHLTRRALFGALCQSASRALKAEEYDIPKSGFIEELYFNFTKYEE